MVYIRCPFMGRPSLARIVVYAVVMSPPRLQHRHILAHGVLTHTHRFPDVPVTGPALMCLPILQILQIAVDRQLSVCQSQKEDLVGEGEKMFEFLLTVPSVETQCSPVPFPGGAVTPP